VLSKIHHVGVVVKSGDEALRFYRDLLGLPVTVDRVVDDQGVRGILLKVGESEIELLEPTRDDTGVARFLATRGEGMHHVCFESDDVAMELEGARAKGIELIDQAPRIGLAGRIAFLHPKSNHGCLVEYATPIEPAHAAPAAPQAAAQVAARKIDHLGIVVKDIPTAQGTFKHNFALAADTSRGGELPALGIRNSFLPIGESDIELIQPIVSEGPVAKFAAERGEGMFLLSVAVADVERAVAHLKENGVRASNPGSGGVSFLSMASTHGVNLQLVQRRL